ncbi:MAG: DUF5069 domain-containing protein [Verrucomicrobiota bacterium]
MQGYHYLTQIEALWQHAVAQYREGQREPDDLFSPEQLQIITENGFKVMDFFDAAEDFVSSGEPDFATFVATNDVRRNFFLIEQRGIHANFEISIDDLPAKNADMDGIVWLPRILPKARAKLQGALPPEIMYGCGGDRRFFKTHDLHPAEFLQVVWRAGDDDQKILEYVKSKTILA